VVLQLDADLPLVGLVPDERVLQQLLRGGPLGVVLHQARLDEAEELLGPGGRRVEVEGGGGGDGGGGGRDGGGGGEGGDEVRGVAEVLMEVGGGRGRWRWEVEVMAEEGGRDGCRRGLVQLRL